MALTRTQKLEFFTTRVLQSLASDSIIAPLLRNAIEYVSEPGAYTYGDTVNITIADKRSTTIHTDLDANPDVSYTKGQITNFPVTLTALAETNITMDSLDRVISSHNEGVVDSFLTQSVTDFVEAIEKDLYVRTFNLASLDANTLGTTGDTMTIADIINLEKEFLNDKWKGVVNCVISPTVAAQLKTDFTNRYTSFTAQEGTQVGRQGFVINEVPNVRFYTSTELPTLTELTNITGTSTNLVNFAFAEQSVALFNPEIRDESGGDFPGIRVSNNNAGGMNYQLTEYAKGDTVINQFFTKMLSLYGTGIFRPNLVKPVLGGTIS